MSGDGDDRDAGTVSLSSVPDPELVAALKVGTRAAATELLERLPVARTYFAILDYASRRAQEREAATFFELVAKHSRAGNTGDLLVDLVAGLDKQHVYEAVTLGYQAMRSCADEALKPCLAVLVSQQIYEPNLPTAYYRAASGLLVGLDPVAARAVAILVEHVAEFAATGWKESDWGTALARCDQVLEGHDGRTFWACSRSGARDAGIYRYHHVQDLPAEAEGAVRHLERELWVSRGRGMSTRLPNAGEVRGALWVDLPPDRLPWFKSLHDCLLVLEVT